MIMLAKTAGFCFGVSRAVEMAQNGCLEHGEIYTLGPVIHNSNVIKRLETQGIHASAGIDEIPDASFVVIRSHGVSKKTYEILSEKGCRYIDATCPFVSKIHDIVRREADEGRKILIIGTSGHPEVSGIQGWCENAEVIENENSLTEWFNNTEGAAALPISVVAQTTSNSCIFKSCIAFLKKACTNVRIFDTICNATVMRQKEAQELASHSDYMIVIGDRESSNTKRLFEICSRFCEKTALIESADELDIASVKSARRIGVTAGASTPAWIIKEVMDTMSDEVRTESSESFAELLEHSFKTLNTGDKVEGVVTNITPTEIQVDLGVKHAGYITISELSDDPSYKVEEHLKVGDKIEAFVIRVNDLEGMIMLSKKRLDSIKGWETIEAAREDKTPVEGIIVEENKGGVVAVCSGVRVFIPASQSGLAKDKPLSELLKTKQRLRITEVNRARRRVVGSIRAVLMEERRNNSEKIWETIEVGNEYRGVVKSLTSYGAFVDIGGIDGMVHVSELSWNRIKHPSEVLNVGDEIDVRVIGLDRDKKKISLGYRQSKNNPWNLFEEKYKIGDVASVKVVKFMPFGAFAEIIPGVDGLIHISQIAMRRIEKAEDALKLGQVIDVRITDIDKDKKKISLSVKALSMPPVPDEGNAPKAEEAPTIVASSGEENDIIPEADAPAEEAKTEE
ncbi:MAG: bifunctional 4-hydroxy-3-methylbut-2-enyl diphosphate reductase/30S ribosomal protein S1 [Bacillota bacterium]|nr:bifunctional 4-hydroxy-3-methylbut-2-enyl diphosphate reductase/30S ribosomal protein S1 [Bacillota bacterium]